MKKHKELLNSSIGFENSILISYKKIVIFKSNAVHINVLKIAFLDSINNIKNLF